MLSDFDSIQGPLKEKLVDLVRALGETKSDLEAATRALKKKDISLEKMSKAKAEADEVIDVLKAELEAMRKKNDADMTSFQESIDQLTEENEMLKTGE